MMYRSSCSSDPDAMLSTSVARKRSNSRSYSAFISCISSFVQQHRICAVLTSHHGWRANLNGVAMSGLWVVQGPMLLYMHRARYSPRDMSSPCTSP